MEHIRRVLKATLIAYIMTGLLLLLLTFLVYRYEIAEEFVDMGIIGIYLISTFIGGFFIGKMTGRRKFLWGILVGGVYIGILFGVSKVAYGQMELLPILLSVGGGMFGGMVA